jgi:hypothetical protein
MSVCKNVPALQVSKFGCELLMAVTVKNTVFWIVTCVGRRQPDVSEEHRGELRWRCLPSASFRFLFGSVFDPKDGGDMFF